MPKITTRYYTESRRIYKLFKCPYCGEYNTDFEDISSTDQIHWFDNTYRERVHEDLVCKIDEIKRLKTADDYKRASLSGVCSHCERKPFWAMFYKKIITSIRVAAAVISFIAFMVFCNNDMDGEILTSVIVMFLTSLLIFLGTVLYNKIICNKLKEIPKDCLPIVCLTLGALKRAIEENVPANESGSVWKWAFLGSGIAPVIEEAKVEETVDKKKGQYLFTCEMCNQGCDKITYAKIKDNMGIRYRNLCDECMEKYNAVPTPKK